MKFIINPLENPILIPVLQRAFIVYFLGFILILILNKLKFNGLWKTNIGKRYLSWLIIGPFYLVTVLFAGDFSLIIMILIMILAINEIEKVAKFPKLYVYALYFLSIFSAYIASRHLKFFYSLPLFYYLILSMTTLRLNDPKKGLFDISLTMFISIWIIFSLSHFVLLAQLNTSLDLTKSLMLLIGFAVPLSDIFAYIIGKSFHKLGILDKLKIAGKISPNKTYIGILGNITGAGIGIFIMYFALKDYLSIYHWIILSFVIGISGVVGDLTASLFKRYYKIKDSGNLIPGHGGLIDRIDSTLRIIVVIYYYITFFI